MRSSTLRTRSGRSVVEGTGRGLFLSNYELYGEMSARVMATIERMFPREEEHR